jgi:glycosyltransferase involved in cell wall biosynthesis
MHARQRPVLGWGLGAPNPRRGLGAGWRNSFFRQLDGIIAYSQQGAREYRLLGFPANIVFVAPNAVAAAPGTPTVRAPRPRATVLYVGRLQTRKRIDALMCACAALPADLQPDLEIVGDGPERPKLEHLASKTYPLAKFFGALHGSGLDTRFDNADLFVLPGTGGLAVQQAMAHGLPLLVAEGDGSQRDMVRPENGWLVPPNEDTALRAALHQALSDRARLARMGAESLRLARTEFNIEAMVAGFLAALHGVA